MDKPVADSTHQYAAKRLRKEGLKREGRAITKMNTKFPTFNIAAEHENGPIRSAHPGHRPIPLKRGKGASA